MMTNWKARWGGRWVLVETVGASAGYWCCGVFFFFQAEDGIRDVAVTGVQTCALPILTLLDDTARRRAREHRRGGARGPDDVVASLPGHSRNRGHLRSLADRGRPADRKSGG